MIISLLCGEISFTCSLVQWNKFRIELAKATNKFLVDFQNTLINHDDNIYENIYDIICQNISNNDCDNASEIYKLAFKKDKLLFLLELFFKDIKHIFFETRPDIPCDSINIALLKIYLYYLDFLVVIGVSGIYSLFNKDETEAFYSVGNAKDICETISKVARFIEDDFTKNVLYDVKRVFNASVLNENIISVKTIYDSEPKKNLQNDHIVKKIHRNGSLTGKLFIKKFLMKNK